MKKIVVTNMILTEIPEGNIVTRQIIEERENATRDREQKATRNA